MIQYLKIVLIYLSCCITSQARTQVIQSGDSIYFGPGLSIPVSSQIKVDGARRDKQDILSNENHGRVFFKADFIYTNNVLLDNEVDEFRYSYTKPMYSYDSLGRKYELIQKIGAFNYKFIEAECIELDENRRIKSKVKNIYVQLDTIIQDVIRIGLYMSCKDRRQLSELKKMLSFVHVVDIAHFPQNLLEFEEDDVIKNEIRSSTGNLFSKEMLSCSTPANIEEDYPKIYSRELDSLFEQFEYEELSRLLQERYFAWKWNDWTSKKELIETRLGQYGNMSIQREYGILKKWKNQQIPLSDFMNYKVGNLYKSILDTLYFLKVRQICFDTLIKEIDDNLHIEPCDFYFNNATWRSFNLADLLEAKKVKLDISNGLPHYIYRKYLNGSKSHPNYRQLQFDDQHLIYEFSPDDESLEAKILVTIQSEGDGNWVLKMDTLRGDIVSAELNTSFRFNGVTGFRAGADYLFLEAMSSGMNTFYFRSFPDSIDNYPIQVNVNSNDELISTKFYHIKKVSKLSQSEGVVEVQQVIDRKSSVKDLSTLRDYRAGEIVYLRKEELDFNQDGASDILSYGVCNGKLIFCHSLTMTNNGLGKLSENDVWAYLDSSQLFQNILLFSLIGREDGK